MEPSLDAIVFVVDDDANVRDALTWLLRSRHLSCESYDSAEVFFRMLEAKGAFAQPCCLLLDVRMPGMSGLALFEKLIAQKWVERMPVIFLTGHADIPTAVDTVKRGAFDFFEKPFSDNSLVDRVEQALQKSAQNLHAQHRNTRVQAKLADLTDREREVMRCIVDGLPNKQIALQLEISVRTVEVHRARIFEKMRVKSAVELANMLRSKVEV